MLKTTLLLLISFYSFAQVNKTDSVRAIQEFEMIQVCDNIFKNILVATKTLNEELLNSQFSDSFFSLDNGKITDVQQGLIKSMNKHPDFVASIKSENYLSVKKIDSVAIIDVLCNSNIMQAGTSTKGRFALTIILRYNKLLKKWQIENWHDTELK